MSIGKGKPTEPWRTRRHDYLVSTGRFEDIKREGLEHAGEPEPPHRRAPKETPRAFVLRWIWS